MAADKPKPPKSQSAPSGGFDGYEMSFVRERQPEWQQPQTRPPETGEWAVPQPEPWAARNSRGPRPLVVLAAVLLLIAVLLVVLLA